MIFKNHIKKKKILEDIKNINSRLDSLQEQIEEFYSTAKELKRILRYHSHGQITGFSKTLCEYFEYEEGGGGETYVYQNGKEYIFDDIFIKNPEFTQGEKENIVYAKSGDGTKKYVLDLFQNKAIEIEHRMDDNKYEPQ